MFYIMKIIESLIVPPGLFVVVGLLLIWFANRQRRRRQSLTGLLALAILYAVCTPFIGNVLLRPLETTYPQPSHPKGDVIVVLGGGYTVGTPDVTGRGNLFGDSSSRLVTSAILYRQLHVPILLSGGPNTIAKGIDYSFAAIGQRELEDLGIPPNMIYTEPNSRNTQENAEFSIKLLHAHHLSHPILVTSAYHMPRAVLDFKRAGMNVEPYPTAYLVNRASEPYSFLWLPSMQGLQNTYTAVREYIGIVATKLGVRG